MDRKQRWLEAFNWEMVTAQNAILCSAKKSRHGPTPDGYEETKALWEIKHREVMDLEDAVDLCRHCHRMAPFCSYNGNTFSSVIGLIIRKLDLPPAQGVIIRSIAGHIVAGVASDEETKAFREFCGSLG